jgi:hypothetical protein
VSEWTTPDQIKLKLRREWDRGRILGAVLGEDTVFPLRIPLKGPTPREWVDRFSTAQKWVASIRHQSTEARTRGYRLEWREINHRTLGRNRVPAAAMFDTPEQAAAVLEYEEAIPKVKAARAVVVQAFPELDAWVKDNPLKVLSYAEEWPKLLAVLRWVRTHPRSGLYIRQADIPGVDTKFIEQHRGSMSLLLDRVLPPDAIYSAYQGATAFTERYGFRAKPALIRFRLLDPSLGVGGYTDLTVTAEEFAAYPIEVERVVVVENETEFLALPHVPSAAAIFGAGYGLKRFERAHWLNAKDVYYWGDIDTHGFAILDEFRQYVPQAKSLLMDRETLMTYREFWGHEDRGQRRDLTRLTSDEAAFYRDICEGRYGYGVRLEQEQIPMAAVADILQRGGSTRRI